MVWVYCARQRECGLSGCCEWVKKVIILLWFSCIRVGVGTPVVLVGIDNCVQCCGRGDAGGVQRFVLLMAMQYPLCAQDFSLVVLYLLSFVALVGLVQISGAYAHILLLWRGWYG